MVFPVRELIDGTKAGCGELTLQVSGETLRLIAQRLHPQVAGNSQIPQCRGKCRLTMDIELFGKAVAAVHSTLALIKEAIDLLPSSQKAEAEAALARAERESRVAEAKASESLGHRICHGHWPCGIMVELEEKGHWKCPECGHEIEPPRLPSPNQLAFGRPPRWQP